MSFIRLSLPLSPSFITASPPLSFAIALSSLFQSLSPCIVLLKKTKKKLKICIHFTYHFCLSVLSQIFLSFFSLSHFIVLTPYIITHVIFLFQIISVPLCYRLGLWKETQIGRDPSGSDQVTIIISYILPSVGDYYLSDLRLRFSAFSSRNLNHVHYTKGLH